jgi:hypothetical protein
MLRATRSSRPKTGFGRRQTSLSRLPQIAASKTAPIDIGIRSRCDRICPTGRLGNTSLSEGAKNGRFPFPFPGGSIGGKRETALWGAPIRRGPGESVTRSDRRGRELGLEARPRRSPAPRESDGARIRVAVSGKCTITEGQNGTPSFTESREADFGLNHCAHAHLTNFFDISLEWRRKCDGSPTTRALLKQAIHDQLGLCKCQS